MRFTDVHFDIIKILANDDGYCQRQLSEILGKQKSNLSRDLKALEKDIAGEDGNYLRIRPWDIKDPCKLGHMIKHSRDPISTKLWNNIMVEWKETPESMKGDMSLKSRLCSEYFLSKRMNDLIEGPSLFDVVDINKSALPQKIQALIKSEPNSPDLRLINRLLVEETFPGQIASYNKPIIYQGIERKTTNKESMCPRKNEIPLFINHDLTVLKMIVDSIKDKLDEFEIEERYNELHLKKASKRKSKELRNGPTKGNAIQLDDSNVKSMIPVSEKYNDLGQWFFDFCYSNYVEGIVREYGLIRVLAIIQERVPFEAFQLADLVLKLCRNECVKREDDVREARRIIKIADEKYERGMKIKGYI